MPLQTLQEFIRSNINDPKPFSGWALERALRVDEDSTFPVVVTLLRAREMRRSVVFAILAMKTINQVADAFGLANDQAGLHAAAERLFTTKGRDLLAQVFGQVQGLHRALCKTAGDPLSRPSDYDLLMRFLNGAGPGDRLRANAIAHVQQITSRYLRVLEHIDDALVHPEIITRLNGKMAAQEANRLLAFVQSRSSAKIGFEQVKSFIEGDEMSGPDWAKSILGRFGDRFPVGPLASDDFLKPIIGGKDFASIGRKWRNCLGSKIIDAATGCRAYYIAATKPKCIIELHQFTVNGTNNIWTLEDIYTHANGAVPPEAASKVEEYLSNHGITRIKKAFSADLSPVVLEALCLSADSPFALFF